MNIEQAYNNWSQTYDAIENKTRDLEARALREMISGDGLKILEIGCGTGKNTEFLLTKAAKLISADFSAEMLAQARMKISAENVEFKRMDLCETWKFADESFDLIACSLVLEHIENLDFIFAQARRVLRPDGKFYIGELHPFKQYRGSKARFETAAGMFELECFTHNFSDFFAAGRSGNFELIELKEWCDTGESISPRLLTMIFQPKL